MDADRRLAITSRWCGHSGLLLAESGAKVAVRKVAVRLGGLLLKQLAAGVSDGYCKSVKVIDAVAFVWTTKANARVLLVWMKGGGDGAAFHRAGLRRNFVCPLALAVADNKFRRRLQRGLRDHTATTWKAHRHQRFVCRAKG